MRTQSALHVVFGPGRYQPFSAAGRRLLAHELAHVVQQAGGRSGAPADGARPPGDVFEREAERWAAGAGPRGGLPRATAPVDTIQRQGWTGLVARGPTDILVERNVSWFQKPENQQFLRDLFASIRESLQHAFEVLGEELFEQIRDHLSQVCWSPPE